VVRRVAGGLGDLSPITEKLFNLLEFLRENSEIPPLKSIPFEKFLDMPLIRVQISGFKKLKKY